MSDVTLRWNHEKNKLAEYDVKMESTKLCALIQANDKQNYNKIVFDI
jgi:hypothetical protein